jgi:ACS family glucarate transporter-like MFS transporter
VPIRYLLILGAFLISMLMWIDRACISAAKDNIAGDLNLSPTQMGWVMGAFSLGYALFQVPGGKLADRFGPRVVMAGVCVAWSVFTGLTSVVRQAAMLIGVRFLFGVGEAGGYPTISRAIYSWLPIGERGITNSLIFSGGRLGAAIAMPGVVWLIAVTGGWQQAFYLLGAVGLVVAVAWYVLFRNMPEEHFAVSAGEAEYIKTHRAADAALSMEDDRTGIASLGQILSAPTMWMLMVQYVAHNFTFFFVVSWFFDYMKRTFELTAVETGWYAMMPLLCGVLGNWLAGAMVDTLYRKGHWNLSRRLPAVIGFALAATGMAMCINMDTPQTAVMAMCLAIFGSDMVLSPSWTTCLDVGGRNAGTVSGAMNMVGNLGAFFTSILFPMLYKSVQSHEPFFYLAAGLNVVAIFLWFMIRPDRPLVDLEVANG